MAGNGEQAARLLGVVAALREKLHLPSIAVERADVEWTVIPARAALGEEAWAEAHEVGRAVTLEEAIAEALGEGLAFGTEGREVGGERTSQ